ncbi:MAG: alpha/beta hydrolase [Alphaproteobacteria bacterium]|nr:alpha/beta hydrolase [Alphaproteobacteria bacterium]
MTDDQTREHLIGRLPRLIGSGVDYNDAMQVISGMQEVADWSRGWEAVGARHEARGDEALKAGKTVTAGEAFFRAAISFHTGQSGNVEDPDEKFRVQTLQREAYLKAMPHLRPPTERIEIPFEDIVFPGNLRLPDGGDGPYPCVLLNAGADSTKEEFFTLENEFLKRGMATCAYDGPGQGMTWRDMKLRGDFEAPVGAVLDVLAERPEIDADRFGIWGRSMGGYAAPRVSAHDRRIQAAIALGGYFDLQGFWDISSDVLLDILQFAFGADSRAAAREKAGDFSLVGIAANIACPLLVVHSDGDEICPLAEAERMAREAPHAELVVFEAGNHCCDNMPALVRPLMADWMAERLGAATG